MNDATHKITQRLSSILLALMGLASLVAAELTIAGVIA